ncbi:metal-dependent hydrolase [Lusitaniella coriacea LEGE 07157]|uniref:Metal-dependent hydrolase n=1 Tax=Lusitaniella coriacea LEGE 07157 TaxID=945747 RepID=A0A8J7DV31_9CYAN|nr:metal-dependent hydrolase [Lusitaniella coriacea]MBE9115523.1 metal-dependent hydrolase [Lusitaniella coriacea LEGE 07157]
MSSFIGHSIAATTIYYVRNRTLNEFKQKLWFVWLIVLASIPDLDYIVPFLNRAHYDNARVTHSFVFSLLFPFCTILGLFLAGSRGKSLKILGLQAIASGLSHLVLDLCVGVTPLPLLFPFSSHLFKLPFGFLPSAGKLNPTNYFLYRNLAIELGFLLPLTGVSLICFQRGIGSCNRNILKIVVLLLISLGFAIWGWRLPR